MNKVNLKNTLSTERVLRALYRQWFAIIILLIFALALNIGQPLRLDDSAFMQMYEKDGPDLWIWAQEYWTTWSGRVLPHAVFVFLMNIGPELVNFINAILQAASIYLAAMFVIRKPEKRRGPLWSLILLVIMGFFYLATSEYVLSVSVFWKTAAVLYVWGYAAMLFALVPMLHFYETGENSSVRMWILAGLSAVYAAGFEQSGGFFTAMGAILIAAAYLRRGKVQKGAAIVWAVGTFATFFFIMSPGNFIRYSEEVLFWFPNFGTLSYIDRLLLGISYTLRYCLTDLYVPMLVIAVGTFAVICLRKTSYIIKITAALPALYYMLYRVRKVPMLYDYVFPDNVNGYTSANWIAETVGLFIVFLLIFLLFVHIDKRPDPVTASFFAGGLAESVIMGYTPTIIVSMSRCTFFSREVLMVPMFYIVLRFFRELGIYIQRRG